MTGGNKSYSVLCVSTGHCSTLLFRTVLSPASSHFLTYRHSLLLYIRGIEHRTSCKLSGRSTTWAITSPLSRRGCSVDLLGYLSEQLSPLWYSVLGTLIAFVSLDFQLHLLNSGILPGPTLLPYALPGNFQGSKLGQLQGSLHLFFICQGWLFFIAWYPVSWKPLFFVFGHVGFQVDLFIYFVVYSERANPVPVNYVLAKSRSLVYL